MIDIHIQIDEQGRMSLASNFQGPPAMFIGILEQAKLGLMLGGKAEAPRGPELVIPTGPIPDLKATPKGLRPVK